MFVKSTHFKQVCQLLLSLIVVYKLMPGQGCLGHRPLCSDSFSIDTLFKFVGFAQSVHICQLCLKSESCFFFYSLGFVLINYSTYGVKLNLGFFTLCSKAFSQIILSVIFRASNHQLVDKKELKLIWFKLSNLNSNLALTLGYLNPALNNSAMASTLFLCYLNIYRQKYTARAEFHVKTLPESPPIKGLFSKCSTNSLKHEKVPIPNLYCEPSQPIWKCFTELAHLKKKGK